MKKIALGLIATLTLAGCASFPHLLDSIEYPSRGPDHSRTFVAIERIEQEAQLAGPLSTFKSALGKVSSLSNKEKQEVLDRITKNVGSGLYYVHFQQQKTDIFFGGFPDDDYLLVGNDLEIKFSVLGQGNAPIELEVYPWIFQKVIQDKSERITTNSYCWFVVAPELSDKTIKQLAEYRMGISLPDGKDRLISLGN